MLAASTDQLSATGSDAALLIPKGMVSVSIPISRLSSVSYAPQRGDHVSVIVTLMFVDLDSDFQTRLPNSSAAVLGSGNSVLIGPGAEVSDQPGSLNASEQIRTLGAQVVTGSQSSPMGRAQVDPAFEQSFYLVPSEEQRPRLVSQTLIRDVIVLQVGNFPLKEERKVALVPAAEVQPGEPTPPPVQAVQEEPQVLPDLITLIVSPQDAVTLNYLIFAGAQLTLALRGTGDDSSIQTEAVTLQYLLSQYNIPVPVKLPYGFEPRVDKLVPPALPNDRNTATPTP
jgi:pilus assembly protein CpaB